MDDDLDFIFKNWMDEGGIDADDLATKIFTMTSTEFENYFYNNILFDNNFRELEAVMREEKELGNVEYRMLYKEAAISIDFERNNLNKFKSIMESFNALKKLHFTKDLLIIMQSDPRFNDYNPGKILQTVSKFEEIDNLKYNLIYTDDNISLLQRAVQWKKPLIVKYLLSKGANVNYLSHKKTKSILSYLVMCNSSFWRNTNNFAVYKNRYRRIFKVLHNIQSIGRKPTDTYMNINYFNLNSDVIRDIVYELNINEYPEGNEDPFSADTNENEKNKMTCTALDFKQKLKAYFPQLLLNSQDSEFLNHYLRNNGDNVRKYLEKMDDKVEDQVDELRGNTEKKLYNITNFVPHDKLDRVMKLINQTKILTITPEATSYILKGYFPSYMKYIGIKELKDFYSSKDFYSLPNPEPISLVLSGISAYEMSIQTAYEKLKILFQNQEVKMEYMNKKKFDAKCQFLHKLVTISLGLNLEGQNKKDYFQYFELLIRLLMKFDPMREIIHLGWIEHFVVLFSPKLLQDWCDWYKLIQFPEWELFWFNETHVDSVIEIMKKKNITMDNVSLKYKSQKDTFIKFFSFVSLEGIMDSFFHSAIQFEKEVEDNWISDIFLEVVETPKHSDTFQKWINNTNPFDFSYKMSLKMLKKLLKYVKEEYKMNQLDNVIYSLSNDISRNDYEKIKLLFDNGFKIDAYAVQDKMVELLKTPLTIISKKTFILVLSNFNEQEFDDCIGRLNYQNLFNAYNIGPNDEIRELPPEFKEFLKFLFDKEIIKKLIINKKTLNGYYMFEAINKNYERDTSEEDILYFITMQQALLQSQNYEQLFDLLEGKTDAREKNYLEKNRYAPSNINNSDYEKNLFSYLDSVNKLDTERLRYIMQKENITNKKRAIMEWIGKNLTEFINKTFDDYEQDEALDRIKLLDISVDNQYIDLMISSKKIEKKTSAYKLKF